MEYLASQQRAQWVFTPESLSAAREQSRMNAAKAAATAREEEARLRGEAGAAVGEDGGEGGGEGAGLTVAEEGVLLRQSQVQMQETAERMGIPAHVTAVALSLFKCFYVRHAVSDHLPWQIMPACLMAAVKAEECPMFQAERTPFSVDKFLRAMDAAHNQSAQGQAKRRLISPAELVRLETVLMDGLGFFLMVYTPLHSLPAAIRHAKHALKLPAEVLDRVKAEATASAKEAMLTDAPLLMHPGEIALACLVEALSGALPEGRVGEYLASVAVQAAERQQERAEALGHMWRSGAEFRTDGAGGGEKSRSGAAQCEDAANHAGRTCSGDAEELTKRISWGRDIISQGVEQLRRDREEHRMRELAEKARVSRNPAGDPRSLIFKKRKEEAKDGGKHKGKGKKRKASEEAAFGDD